MPRHKKYRYVFFNGEHAFVQDVVHVVDTSWFDSTSARNCFVTKCGAIAFCKGNRRTTRKLTCIVCIDGGIFKTESQH